MTQKPRTRRYRHALINVYKPVRGNDAEGWGVETTEYEFSHQQKALYITTSALQGGVRQQHHAREEHLSIWEAIVYSFPPIDDGDHIALVASNGKDDDVRWVVTKQLVIGRNRTRLILQENPALIKNEAEDSA
jgi:hypothetical protein